MDLSHIVQNISIWALPIIFAITFHEVAHGYVASLFGDYSARLAGRLSLNPARHIDWFGTIFLPLLFIMMSSPFMFGWAKPVPIDARNMRHPRRQMVFVAVAGPLANLVMAVLWAGVAKIGAILIASHSWGGEALHLMGFAGIQINVVLAVLNCLPLPPLDGGRVLMNLLPPRIAYRLLPLEAYGIFILLILAATNILSFILMPPCQMLIETIMSAFSLY